MKSADAATNTAIVPRTEHGLVRLVPVTSGGATSRPFRQVSLIRKAASLQVFSPLPQSDKEYWISEQSFQLADNQTCSALSCMFGADGDLNIKGLVYMFGADGHQLCRVDLPAGEPCDIEIETGAVSFKVGFWVAGEGSCHIRRMSIGRLELAGADFCGSAKYLLVSRSYPSTDQLYKYPFVHRRVLGYRQHGVEMDVLSFETGGDLSCYTFEGVTCLIGSAAELDAIVECGAYDRVIVHGLSQQIWSSLERHVGSKKITGWLHGSEIHSFHRFAKHNKTKLEQAAAEDSFQGVLAFWRNLLQPMPENLNLVFVSRFAAADAMRDLGLDLPMAQYEVIPNPVDTDLFNYIPKSSEQRFKVLSIRPFDTTRYANDLTVQIILALTKLSCFDQFEFHIIGDGPLFEDTLAPLRGFSNVRIERKFIRQHEIATLHKEYGVFLVPTRMDTHGVSRDEAMSSGLVPVTNAVSAIPEYADDDCAILGGADEFQSLADGIGRLVNDPTLFIQMSKAAAEKVRAASGYEIVIPRELAVIQQ